MQGGACTSSFPFPFLPACPSVPPSSCSPFSSPSFTSFFLLFPFFFSPVLSILTPFFFGFFQFLIYLLLIDGVIKFIKISLRMSFSQVSVLCLYVAQRGRSDASSCPQESQTLEAKGLAHSEGAGAGALASWALPSTSERPGQAPLLGMSKGLRNFLRYPWLDSSDMGRQPPLGRAVLTRGAGVQILIIPTEPLVLSSADSQGRAQPTSMVMLVRKGRNTLKSTRKVSPYVCVRACVYVCVCFLLFFSFSRYQTSRKHLYKLFSCSGR